MRGKDKAGRERKREGIKDEKEGDRNADIGCDVS